MSIILNSRNLFGDLDTGYYGGVITPVVQAIRRYFTELESPLQSHFEVEKEIALTGDFDKEGYFLSSNSSGKFIFSGGNGNEGFELYKNGSGNLNIYHSGSSKGGGGSYQVDDNKFHHYKIIRRGFTTKLFIDGNEVGTVSISGTCRIKVYGHRLNATFFWQGYLGEQTVTDYTKPVGQQVTKFKLDNSADMNEYGAELVVNGGFDSNVNNWTAPSGSGNTLSWENGRAKLTTVSGYIYCHQEVPVEVGKLYRVKGLSEGGYIQVREGETGRNIINNIFNDNPYFIAETTTVKIRIHSASAIGDIYFDDVSIKEVINLVDNKIEYSEGTTFGAEMYNYSMVATSGNPALADTGGGDIQTTVSDTATTANRRFYVDLTTVPNQLYVVQFVTDNNSGFIYARDGVTGNGTILESVNFNTGDLITLVFEASSTTTTLLFDHLTTGTFKYLDVTVKELLTGNAITYKNIPDSNHKEYIQDGNDWVGIENYFIPTTVISPWTDNGDGSYTKNADGWGNLGERGSDGTIDSGYYSVSFKAESAAGTSLYNRTADNSGNIVCMTVNDGTTTDHELLLVGRGLWFDNPAGIGAKISNATFHKLLKGA